MSNKDKLKELFCDVFLLEEDEYKETLTKEDIDTWDSLGTVSMAVGIQETFGYHMTPDEANGVSSIPDVVALLATKGVSFDG